MKINRSCCSWLSLSLWLTALIAPPLFAQTQMQAIPKRSPVLKMDGDTKSYRYFTLANQLNVLLVSDPEITKSAAALDVEIGSHQNPISRPGLADFVARVLPAGSEKYPTPGNYQQFISQNNGEFDARIGNEATSYYFSVDNAHLESALDRFAHIFIAPLFDESAIKHEKTRVDTEYVANANNDMQRQWDVYRGLFNPDHPAARMSLGNTEALVDREEHSLRNDVISFYKNYYSANLMSLVIVSNKSLDELEKIAATNFAQIPNGDKIIESNYPPLFLEDALPAQLAIQSVTETRELTFIFPIPAIKTNAQRKAWKYLHHLLHSESPGSLLYLLKSLGWSESLSSSELLISRKDGLLQLSIALTPQGVKAKDQIVSAVFEYLKIMTSRGVNDWRVNELSKMAELEARFGEQPSPLEAARTLAQAMQDYSAKDVLLGDITYPDFDEALIKKMLSYLNKEHVLIAITTPEAKTTAVSAHYKTPYSLTHDVVEVLELKSVYRQKLLLPDKNIFIPQNISVKAPMRLNHKNAADLNKPTVVLKDEQVELWFLQDNVYQLPKAELNFRFLLPELNHSLENAARTELFVALAQEQLEQYRYLALLAGLEFTLIANTRGFDLHVAGYTDKQNLLVNKIIGVITKLDLNQNRFNALKANLLDGWNNSENNALLSNRMTSDILRLQYIPYWRLSEYATALEKTSFEEFSSFAKNILRDAKIESLFYGNLYAQDAIKVIALIDHQMLKQKSNRSPLPSKVISTENKTNKSWLFTSVRNTAGLNIVGLYVPTLSTETDVVAHTLLLQKVLAAAFSHHMSNEKLLANMSGFSSLPIEGKEGSVFFIQSALMSSEQLAAELNGFLLAMSTGIAENLSYHKNVLLNQLRKSPASMAEQADLHWHSVLINDKDFSRQQAIIAAVAKITPESLSYYYKHIFLQKNRRLWLSTNDIGASMNADPISNISEYQKQQVSY